jgi:hypothetical protein
MFLPSNNSASNSAEIESSKFNSPLAIFWTLFKLEPNLEAAIAASANP